MLPSAASSQDILSTYLDLMKLEKLEIGGVRGRALSLQIQSLYQEFLDSYRVFTAKPYDCLDGTNMVCITAMDCGALWMPSGKLQGCVSIATLWSTYLFEHCKALLLNNLPPQLPGHSAFCGPQTPSPPPQLLYFKCQVSCRFSSPHIGTRQFILLVRSSQS